MSAAGTAARIVFSLRTLGPQTAEELAERLGLALAEVRMAASELAPRDTKAESPSDAAYLSTGPIVVLSDGLLAVRGGPTHRETAT